MLLLDTGARRAELADLHLAHVDLDLDVLLVLGKGRRERALPFGHKAGEALERYLRVRARHRHAELPWLWIGLRGRLTAYGVVMLLRRRGRQAGLPGLHPHQLRHTFAHQWLAEGGGETDLMRLAGWKSRQMLQRYGASAADARAVRPIVGSPRPTVCNRRQLTSRSVRFGMAGRHQANIAKPSTPLQPEFVIVMGRWLAGGSDRWGRGPAGGTATATRRHYELVPDAGRMAGRSKVWKASGVRKAVISWICVPRRVSTSMARGIKVCVFPSQA
jgi:hypothetical protein